MLLSLALMIFLGFALGGLAARMKLPPLLSMMLTGMLLGPYALDLIAPSLLTAPLGAACMDLSDKKLLQKSNSN